MTGEEVRRCRRVRHELFARFKTSDEIFAWLHELEKEQGPRHMVRIGRAQVNKNMKPAARNGKPANGKAVRKA